MEANDAGKILFAGAILVLLVTTLVAFGALFMVSFVGNLQDTSADTTTTAHFTGVAATPSQLSAPIISVGYFGKAAKLVTVNTTAQVGANGSVNLAIDSHASNLGAAWDKINITINSTSNASSNATWVVGTCNAANKSLGMLGTDTWNDILSSCLTPGSNLVLTFANSTTAGESVNITGVSISYFRYATSTAYTKNDAAGTVTPTASGYYEITYTYGAGGIDYTNAKTALNSGITTITGIPAWLSTIVLVFVLLVVFALLALIVYAVRGMSGKNE